MIVASAGIAAAYLVYEKQRYKAVEPEALAHAWYYDETIAGFVGGPGTAAFGGVAAVDAGVVDGAVNGVGRVLTLAGGQLRKLQTGYVRSYAAGIGVGAVALLGWFVVRGMF